MKLIAKCLLCLFVAALMLPVTAYADNAKTYAIKELGMTLKIPADLAVLTLNMAGDDPALGAFSLTAQQANEELQSSNMYLFACTNSGSYGIDVAAKPSDYAKTTGKTSGLTDQIRNDLKDSLQKSYENSGDTNISFSQYDTPNISYLVARHKHLNSDGSATYFIEYHTLYGGQEINIVLSSNDGPPPKERETLLQNIIDDAVYGPVSGPSASAPPAPAPSSTPQPANVYVDSTAAVQFTVPAGWHAISMDGDDRPYIEAKFTNSNSDWIAYGHLSLWDAATPQERTGKTREDYKHVVPTFSQIAKIFQEYGFVLEPAESETIGNTEYLNMKVKTEQGYAPSTFQYEDTIHIFIDNGWMYVFQYNCYNQSPTYSDYMQLLSSVQYTNLSAFPTGQTPLEKSPGPVPTATVAAVVTVQPVASQPLDGTQSLYTALLWVLTFLVSLFLTIALYTMPIVVYRYAIRKEPIPPSMAKKIAIIYGIVVFVGVLALNYALSGKASSGGVLLWSFVNYYILKGGRPRQTEPTPADPADFDLETFLRKRQQTAATADGSPEQIGNIPEPIAAPAAEAQYCIKCGRELPPGSFYCPTCGAKIDRDAYK